ncbi:AraC family transcriptional regulator [Burkholderia sp. Ac-20353]|uniref:AraC-like transcriptional regulator QhpR n=1 Tax=Burkholderia sp. Ac-20353 TaxID=2703894 RepID=UPI00197CB165|nr:AraC family transcriptional regulator [Burkholderia sp. Ac-20353]MBN3786938.1 AraC family transcriptional regulator [Burkholderia sp. Ac-20353]
MRSTFVRPSASLRPSAAADAGILSAAATGLVRFIECEGGDPDRVLGISGADGVALGQPSACLTLGLYCRILEQAASETGDGNFGLRYGQQFEPTHLGLLGYVALSSPTVGDALRNISALFHHHQQNSLLRVVAHGDLSRVEYQIREQKIVMRRQDAELSLGMFFNILRHALGQHWSPECVHFEHDRPESWRDHERCFGAPAAFTQPCNALVLRSADLARPMPGADEHLLALVRHNLAQLGLPGRQAESLVERTQAAIRQRLADGEPTLDDIAQALNLPSWTLQRRLRIEGCNYQEVLLGVRRQMAIDYLRDPAIQISELAFLLGYSEISAFSRAFHRWLNMSPSEWRRGYLASVPAAWPSATDRE